MYERKESGNSGAYYPAFLCMDVNTPDDLYYLGRYPLDERTEAVFLHEYIHYLQDLTTVAGLARIETIVDQIKWICSVARGQHKLKLPISLNTWAYNVKPNAHSLSICKGDFKAHDKQGRVLAANIVSIDSFELVDSTILYSSGQRFHGKAVARLTFRDQNGIEFQYDVGEMAISESMAYLIENRVYPNVLQRPSDCPYFVVRKIVEWKLQRTIDDLKLIALCDVCLMYSLPGKVLYEMLEKMKTWNASFSPAMIYLYGLGSEMSDKFSRKKNWQEELAMTVNMAKKQFADMFVHPYWQGIKVNTDCAFDAVLDLRKTNIGFFLKIARGERLNLNEQFQMCIKDLGGLGVKTAANAIYNFKPSAASSSEIDSDWFLSLHQFYNILFTSAAIDIHGDNKYLVKECDLKQWCSDSFNRKKERDITSESLNCKYSPWLNVSNQDLAQCSFGRVWAAFGFNRIKLKCK